MKVNALQSTKAGEESILEISSRSTSFNALCFSSAVLLLFPDPRLGVGVRVRVRVKFRVRFRLLRFGS
jgi:hypothetical protein